MFMSPIVGRRGVMGMMGMSPSLGRRRNASFSHIQMEDESHLLKSPSDSIESNEVPVVNGHHFLSQAALATSGGGPSSLPPEVGFCLPGKIRKGPVSQVVQSLRHHPSGSSQHYSSDLGSCPSLLAGKRPLLTRYVGPPGEEDPTIPGGREEALEEFLDTSKGRILVARQGDPKKPAIVTYHDIGLNYRSNFQDFFRSGYMSSVTDSFCIYHVHAPGQGPGARDLPEGFIFPTMDELSEQVEFVMHYYGISQCVGFGVGLGANVLVRFANRRPTMVEGLILINCNSQNAGWVEWLYHKVNIKSLKKLQQQQQQQQLQQQLEPGVLRRNSNESSQESSQPPPAVPNSRRGSIMGCGLPDSVVDYMVWYHLGRPDSNSNRQSGGSVSVASLYRQYFKSSPDVSSAKNMALLLQCYMSRNDLGLARDLAPNGKPMLGSTRTLNVPVLNMTGDQSPHVDATVVLNGRLQPSRCTWMKIQDAAMILEEQPAKVAGAVSLFLQGLGYLMLKTRLRSKSEGVVACQAKYAEYKDNILDGPSIPEATAGQEGAEATQEKPGSASSQPVIVGNLLDLAEMGNNVSIDAQRLMHGP